MINFREMEKKKKFGILFIMGALVVVVLPTVASASNSLILGNLPQEYNKSIKIPRCSIDLLPRNQAREERSKLVAGYLSGFIGKMGD